MEKKACSKADSAIKTHDTLNKTMESAVAGIRESGEHQ